MNVLVIGKHPPLQGGVSAACYYAALEATAHGHNVRIVTNSHGADPTNRIGVFPANAGGEPQTAVHYIQPIPDRSFIPWRQPDLSLLAGLSLTVAGAFTPDFVVGWYLEPYGLAAALVANFLDLPLCLIHAGSDIGRLARYRDLGPAAAAAIQASRYVLTNRAIAHRTLRRLGLRDEQIVEVGWRPVASPSMASRPRASGDFLIGLLSRFNYSDFYADASPRFKALLKRVEPSKPLLSDETPIIALLGKVHPVKGHHNIVLALNHLINTTNVSFRFLLTLSGDEDHVCDFLEFMLQSCPKVADRVLAFPIVHPALVPDLLHHCEIVCCLDHGFPFGPHTPRMVREALAAETAVVCSRESFEKSFPFMALDRQEFCGIVEDPSDPEPLSASLRALLGDRDLRRRRQIAGRHLSRLLEGSWPPEGPLVRLIGAFSTDAADRRDRGSGCEGGERRHRDPPDA